MHWGKGVLMVSITTGVLVLARGCHLLCRNRFRSRNGGASWARAVLRHTLSTASASSTGMQSSSASLRSEMLPAPVMASRVGSFHANASGVKPRKEFPKMLSRGPAMAVNSECRRPRLGRRGLPSLDFSDVPGRDGAVRGRDGAVRGLEPDVRGRDLLGPDGTPVPETAF